MNVKVSRNEACPCGSGKKYKKCCGVKDTVSITQVLENEIDDLQKRILYYACNYYENEIEEAFEDFRQYLLSDGEEEEEFFHFIHSIWYSLFVTLDDGETILEKFIAAEAGKIKRPKLKEILNSWVDARTIVGKITSLENNTLTVEDGLSSEEFKAIVTNLNTNYNKGSFFIGILLPFEQKYVFFPAPFDLPDLSLEQAIDFIRTKSKHASYKSPEAFLTDFFMEIMSDLPTVGGIVDTEEMEWPALVYKEVADRFQQRLESFGVPIPVVEIGVILWYQFCQKKQKRIQNPELYVAALHYLISTFVPLESEYTQKGIAKLYGVSVGTVSAIYREMDDVLEEEITKIIEMSYEEHFGEHEQSPVVQFNPQKGQMATERVLHGAMAELEGKNFDSIDEINEFMNKKLNSPAPKKAAKGKKEQAKLLVYDAFEAEGLQRYKLAKEAMKLDPNCVDAYLILAEGAASLEEAAGMYETGMNVGKKELGKAFFKENKGHFWGLIETRPYMRAKFHYGEALYQLGKNEEAIRQYEELLELNPNDNQGARYSLFISYMEKGDLQNARHLLEKYEEGTAQGLYNQVLLELYEKGFTTKAKKLLKEAKKQNKYVVAFLTEKKRLPKQMPDYYGWGDENEAVIYTDSHLDLWKRVEGIQEWLKKN
ncbi:SEC-C metal-binding domain-containing protein [Neobacillus ginsengisoli]|uniref:Tetratricopeptide (TPR) repeat protein n=1 Tax=Neobacillus ginsengisoli TaxID=904295 RepID=A0ABT9XU21_9BACI|nr:SEC-C metal-binding domain-containing protein [Neobacillus ginsengisoli]MDQ0199053.1 tetratricopeptide (TPR) repeat protein [Neobacillus ginsengisoli]